MQALEKYFISYNLCIYYQVILFTIPMVAFITETIENINPPSTQLFSRSMTLCTVRRGLIESPNQSIHTKKKKKKIL